MWFLQLLTLRELRRQNGWSRPRFWPAVANSVLVIAVVWLIYLLVKTVFGWMGATSIGDGLLIVAMGITVLFLAFASFASRAPVKVMMVTFVVFTALGVRPWNYYAFFAGVIFLIISTIGLLFGGD